MAIILRHTGAGWRGVGGAAEEEECRYYEGAPPRDILCGRLEGLRLSEKEAERIEATQKRPNVQFRYHCVFPQETQQ